MSAFSPLQTLSDLDNELEYIVDVVVQVRDHYKAENDVWINFCSAPYAMTSSLPFLLVSSTPSLLFPSLPYPTLPSFSFSSFQLNAFDSRHLDVIHFDVRLMAFQKSIKHIQEMNTLDMRYLLVIMHNCFHSFEVSKNGVCVS